MIDLIGDPPDSEAETIAHMIASKKPQVKLLTRPVMVRVPLSELRVIDAMADLAGGVSRNQIICQLLKAGIEAVQSHLSVEDSEALAKKQIELTSSILSSPENQSEDL